MKAEAETRLPSARDSLVAAAGLVVNVLVFVVDIVTPLGYAVWVLYLLTVSLALLQRHRAVPALLAVSGIVFTIAGFVLSPPGQNATLSVFNRTLCSVALVALAAAVTQVLAQRERLRRLLWLQQAEASLAQALVGEDTAQDVARKATRMLCELLGGSVGALYRRDDDRLRLAGGHALDEAAVPATLALGQGLVGQALLDGQPRLLSPAPEGHLALHTALGRSPAPHVLILPLQAEGRPVGVVELGLARFTLPQGELAPLAERVAEAVGMPLRSAVYREERQALLDETQRQAEELQAQQEELRVTNEELEAQGQTLRESQARLEVQQTELEEANAQLSTHARTLERQRRELLVSQRDLHAQARQLESASRYKSEFLANMSHELRTPLNSALILSKLLAENRDGRLSDEQVRWSTAIHDANRDLLQLINDILDLSKIEAGRADLVAGTVRLHDLAARLRTVFEPLAAQKALALDIAVDAGAPASIVSDDMRLQQVLKNLLANAIKFTARGRVSLTMRAADDGGVRFDVQDTGVGIAAEQHEVIFEAFRQADGSTSRQYGGTGLGLSISRELVQRLGGTITLQSSPGQGSTFSVTLPAEMPAQDEAESADPPVAPPAAAARPPAPAGAASGRMQAAAPTTDPATDAATEARTPAGNAPAAAVPPTAPPPPRGDRRVLLAVEDDDRFAAALRALVEEMGFDCVVAREGEDALRLAAELRPAGVLLDVGLPDVSGLSVLERLKRDPRTRHIPVHMVSAQERSQAALELGAIGHVVKPAVREQLVEAIEKLRARSDAAQRRVLVVEDDAMLRQSLQALLTAPGIEIVPVGTVEDALKALSTSSFDCMVTDLVLPDASGFDLLERMAASDRHGFPPVIVYTGRALSRDEETRLRRHSRSIIVKGARSPERLLDEVTLFLHSVEASLPGEQQRLLQAARRRDTVLEGRRILLAEDDVRNIFALSSVFEPLGVQLEIARNGREALERLDREPPVDLVLMDVMMPEMDGLTALRAMRARPDLAEVPVIALTAKAMADDRLQCLEAGANDYLAKPLDVDRLVSLCRVWMPK